MSSADNSPIKRRKVRKGTFSCWECKHRKSRCEFRPACSVCISCQRRGLKCVRQDVEDDADQRMDHVEGLIHQLIQQRKRNTGRGTGVMLQCPAPSSPLAGGSLSSFLHTVLPSQPMATLILERGNYKELPSRIFGMDNGERIIDAATRPPPSAHPIIFARKMITLATCLLQLKESPREANRFMEVASRHVTSHDALVNSLDGLEVLMMEATYHISSGNLDAAWLLLRRAVALAQLMGIDGMKKNERAKTLWFLLMTGDRYMSLTLGLSMAVVDDKLAAMPSRHAASELVRMHVVITGRLVNRNVQVKLHPDFIHDDETEALDQMLKQQARCLPSSWWSFKDFTESKKELETYKTVKIIAQLHHYYLIIVLHLPYIIRALRGGITDTYVSYSRMAIPAAAREVLSRFLALREHHRSPTYRGIDDKVVLAMMALLLSHIDGHRLGRLSALEHQRPRDEELINDAISMFEGLRDQSDKELETMKRLVGIEARVADGVRHEWRIGNGDGDGDELKIPCFGTLYALRKDDSYAPTLFANEGLFGSQYLLEDTTPLPTQPFGGTQRSDDIFETM